MSIVRSIVKGGDVGVFQIVDQFDAGGPMADRIEGAWLEADDISSLYQDDAGTVPVTVDADPIGRWSDKSWNNAHFTNAEQGPAYSDAAYDGVTFDGTDFLTSSAFAGATTGILLAIGFDGTDGLADGLENCLWSDRTTGIGTGYRLTIKADDDIEFSAGQGAVYGTEIILDGDFPDNINWVENAGWLIAGGVASATASDETLVQSSVPWVPGDRYKIVYTVSNYVAGTVRWTTDGGDLGTEQSADGTFTEIITMETGATDIRFLGAGFTGDIDDVSVVPISYKTVTTAYPGGPCVVLAWHDGVNLNLQVNGGAISQTAHVTTTVGGTAYLASDIAGLRGFEGEIFALLYLKNDSSTAVERPKINNYINGKTGAY